MKDLKKLERNLSPTRGYVRRMKANLDERMKKLESQIRIVEHTDFYGFSEKINRVERQVEDLKHTFANLLKGK